MPRQLIRSRPTPDQGWLWGWKAIAAYCGVSVGTVQNWHRARAIPLVPVGGWYCVPKET